MDLTPEQLVILRGEIASDPCQLGYAKCLPTSPGQVVLLLNCQSFTRLGAIQKNAFMIWAVRWGERSNIDDHANVFQGSPVRDIALTLEDILQGSVTDLDLGDPEVLMLVSAWPFKTQEASDDLLARAEVPCSRMEQLFGAGSLCTEANVHQAGF